MIVVDGHQEYDGDQVRTQINMRETFKYIPHKIKNQLQYYPDKVFERRNWYNILQKLPKFE